MHQTQDIVTNHLEEPPTSPPVAVLKSERSASLTATQLETLNLMIHGLGLVATAPDTESPPDTSEVPDIPRTPAGYASYLAMLHHAVHTVSNFVKIHTSGPYEDKDVGPALFRLTDIALWNPIEVGAEKDPDFFAQVARILADSDNLGDKHLASKVTYEVFMQYIIHGEREAAASIIDVWEQMLRPTAEHGAMSVPTELHETASILSELVVFSDHPELEEFLQRLAGLIHRHNQL